MHGDAGRDRIEEPSAPFAIAQGACRLITLVLDNFSAFPGLGLGVVSTPLAGVSSTPLSVPAARSLPLLVSGRKGLQEQRLRGRDYAGTGPLRGLRQEASQAPPS